VARDTWNICAERMQKGTTQRVVPPLMLKHLTDAYCGATN